MCDTTNSTNEKQDTGEPTSWASKGFHEHNQYDSLASFPSANSVTCLSVEQTGTWLFYRHVALNRNPSQSAESGIGAGVDRLIHMRRPTDIVPRAELLESLNSTETGTTDVTRQSSAPEMALPKPCCKLHRNYFSLYCRSCDVSSSCLLDEPLVMPPLLPHSVRDESFLDVGTPATRMSEETRTCPVVSPKAAGDRRSDTCQKRPEQPRRESRGMLSAHSSDRN